MTSRPKRHGIKTATFMAEEMIYNQAEEHLSLKRYTEMKAEAGRYLYVAGNYPTSEWEQFVGFTPAADMYYQVNVGVAGDPGQAPNIFAMALICRDVSKDFCHIIWEPGDHWLPPGGRAGT